MADEFTLDDIHEITGKPPLELAACLADLGLVPRDGSVKCGTLKLIRSVLRDINTDHTTVDWASFCREVVLNAFIDNKTPLGGPGKIVEIDESKFGKRKYHRGHPVDGQWIFGGYERGSGRVFMVPVPDRTAATLLPIIKEWVLPGTTIISDFRKSYDCLSAEGYEHMKVNRSLHFKDPDTGAHTNSIESSWRAAKAVTAAAGRKKIHIPGNLAKYMFLKRCREMSVDPAREFFRLAGQLYDAAAPLIPDTFDDADDEDVDLIH